MKYIIGIDVGTSNVKAVVFDEAGQEIESAKRESNIIRTGNNLVEQDMDELWDTVRSCIRDISKQSKTIMDHVVGIGITGQGEGFWLVDQEGKPVQNAILWCDARAVDVVTELVETRKELGREYHETTGTPPLLGNQMILLKWMKEHRPEVLDRGRHLMFCKDWIRYKLTGKIKGETTDSFTSLMEIKEGKIARRLMEKLGIEKYAGYIPPQMESDEVAGYIEEIVAKDLGIPQGIPVIAGALDISATAVGVGAIREKDVCVILGTTCASSVVMQKEKCRPGEEHSRYEKHPVRDLYVELQPTLNGTPNIDWMRDHIAQTRDFAEIDRIIEKVPVGCGGVIYHPYISLAGERAPFYHPYARASFFGIRQDTKREDLIRAVYEGISLSIRDCLQSVKEKRIIFLAGGGAKSEVWAQMISDVMGMKVMVPGGKELGAKGVALMAGVRLGMYESYEQAAEKACDFKRIYEPQAINTKKYDLIYELYKRIRESNQELWNHRHLINKEIRRLEEV